MRLRLQIKFRAFFVTFGSWDDTFLTPIPQVPALSGHVLYDSHGVKLTVL